MLSLAGTPATVVAAIKSYAAYFKVMKQHQEPCRKPIYSVNAGKPRGISPQLSEPSPKACLRCGINKENNLRSYS
ncbi:unnamed protein product [Blepharisma stoltei]|uniref:Uncharacterized protein n=1 Tax=Blepharisma stoltei TaxID=1481888 RepID=A0AAU9JH49_9CILI|nr:unnamed protein product [Blepharisma stoltei]